MARTITVPGVFAGRQTTYEVTTQTTYGVTTEVSPRRSTGRCRWLARQQGSLGWHSGETARAALAAAAYVRDGRRPRWLSVAAAQANEALR